MMPVKIPDGSEGTGMLELACQSTNGGERTIYISGCFLKNDENLQRFIQGHISQLFVDMNKLKNTKFCFLISDHGKLLKQEGIDSKATINYYRFSNSKKDKTCEPVQNPQIVKVDEHALLLCDSKDLNKKCDFLGKYAKNVRAYQTLCMDDIESKEFFGLGKEESKLKFISLKMKKSESNASNDFIVDSSTYEKLEDTGPILLDDKETVVGCFRKTIIGNGKISISIFGKNPEETDNMPSKQEKKKGREDEGEVSKVNDSSSCSEDNSDSEEGVSVSIEEKFKHSSASCQITSKGGGSCQYLIDHRQSKERIMPTEYENPPQPNVREPTQDSESKPSPADQLAQQMSSKEFFERDSENVKALGRFLDRHSMVLKNHEHLADRLEADPMIKLRCKSNTDHSPTYNILQLPKVSVLTVNDLVKNLREMQRNDIANMIEQAIPADDRKSCLKDALKQYEEDVFEKVVCELDKKGFNNWRKLGRQLGNCERDELDQLEMGCNPSKLLLEEYAYKSLELEQLTIASFRQHLGSLDRTDILNLLDEFELKDDERMKDVIPPDSEIMRRLCLLLNKNLNGSLKDWKNLACEWGIPYDIYSQFKPSTKESPTKILLDWLIGAHPEFPVKELCRLLKEMKRNDAREFVEKKLKEYNA